jgi:hypothetical protein
MQVLFGEDFILTATFQKNDSGKGLVGWLIG